MDSLPVFRIYIGNLHFKTTEAELRAYFVKKGVQAQVQHLSPPKVDGAVSGGFAFITVLGREQLNQALAHDHAEGPHGRQKLLVREALPKPPKSR